MDRIRDDSLELNEEVQRIYELLGKVSDQELRRMAKLLAVSGDHELFGQTELELRDRVQPLGAQALEAVAEERQKKVGYEGASLVCLHCQGNARCVAVCGKRIDSLLGRLCFRWHYFHSARCRQGCFLAIDNNASKRALKRVAIGHKIWLFVASRAGGRRVAILYSLVASCEANQVEPWAYLRDVFCVRSAEHRVEEVAGADRSSSVGVLWRDAV